MADDTRQALLERIVDRREGLEAYLRQNRPRVRRRATVALVLSALAAAFTAPPAVGGQSIAGAGVGAVPVWQLLCIAAFLCSVGAAVTGRLGWSESAVQRLNAAESTNVDLDNLATMLEFGTLPLDDAVELYRQYTAKISFVENVPTRPDDAPAAARPPRERPSPRGGRRPPVPPSPR